MKIKLNLLAKSQQKCELYRAQLDKIRKVILSCTCTAHCVVAEQMIHNFATINQGASVSIAYLLTLLGEHRKFKHI